MKYGKTERISGIVILLALLAIFVPWLMSDPAPREERPQPSFVIEQPVAVERRDVAAPERPESVNDLAPSATPSSDTDASAAIEAAPRLPQTDQLDGASEPATTPEAAGSSEPAESPATPRSDPIAELMAANESGSAGSANTGSGSNSNSATQSAPSPSSSAQGEWAIQVGSFGEAANAGRLSEQLSAEGFSVYQRQRDNNMTTVFVGPYATSEDGEAAMASIKERANVQGLLVRVRD
ncbi:MAG: SPOR domain-containing protein [Halomonas sp.]|nr:SPOR domain-containing protein [Halomonas sp.]TVP46812.1 MAG: SPOR domain-containing protein [Halomonas sp.]